MSQKISATIQQKASMLSALQEVFNKIEYQQNSILESYEATGKQEPRTNWKTGEVILDEDGNPEMRDVYETRVRDYDELDDSEKMSFDSYTIIAKHLEKLI